MSDISSSRRMIGTFVFLMFGPICWALQLTAMYGGQSALCAFAASVSPVISAWVLGVSVVTGVLGAVGLAWPGPTYAILTGAKAEGEQWSFLAFVMRVLAALSLLAIAYSALGAVMLPACGALR